MLIDVPGQVLPPALGSRAPWSGHDGCIWNPEALGLSTLSSPSTGGIHIKSIRKLWRYHVSSVCRGVRILYRLYPDGSSHSDPASVRPVFSVSGPGRARQLCPGIQTSIFSAISAASLLLMPRCRTVLSILWTAGHRPIMSRAGLCPVVTSNLDVRRVVAYSKHVRCSPFVRRLRSTSVP
jgi:hypothetical protein